MRTTTDFANWQHWMLIALVAVGALALLYRLASSTHARRQQKKRIVAARVRSGHVPLDIPTTHGDLGDPTTSWANLGHEDGKPRVVDEHPTLRIRYTDAYGKLAERVIEVERVDLHRQAIVAKGNSLYDPRIYPLERIVEVRNHRTGKAFNLGQWVDAVRVARRHRESHSDLQALDSRRA
ncbi:hypothetical protein [Xenophilus sp. Marseille-Q4582]|uniref:hypothetical protein n=1 Tax=Xenophilus sp. Marseille-Q4582 TaxID=2866600 RepID=UPI001CE3B972|nr:hypothetical protein [Xenophilus sp. Marseille-Q4582]